MKNHKHGGINSMNLGEKILKLRKEKGLSQEALAEQLGTTRQAVSKWENNQGYPETEKLLQLSNVFEVSTDFLLKDEKVKTESDEKGYYVSREFALGYISNDKKENLCVGLCFMFWAFSGIPYIMFSGSRTWQLLGIAVCVISGIIAMIAGMFTEQYKYKVLKQEPLIFDYEVLKELSAEYRSIEKKCRLLAVPSLTLFIMGILAIVFTGNGFIPWTNYHSLVFLGFGFGLFGFVYSAGLMEIYELLIHNEQYSSSLLFKLRKKARNKIDKL